MPNLIHQLPNALINKIAAGEVVQRPASVVKELLENAIDADSTTIKVVIKDAGKTLIQVIDNGTGMSESDAGMCFERHATSKISTTEDLFKIQTRGFRGEALAAISAVSQTELETCLQKAQLGTQIIREGIKSKRQTSIAATQGTKITVKNLFFNVPARRNFLKSNAVEMKHIINEFQRAALSQTDIAFSLYQNNTETYHLPIAKLSHRIVHLFGEHYKKQLIHFQESTHLLNIQGYIGKPEYAKKIRGEQFFFVNQRFIKSAYLHHAVKNTLENLLPPNAFPFYVIFIEIDAAQIDVNVHPTKTEVNFEDERMIYSILTSAIKKSLATYQITPSIDFEQAVNFDPFKINSSTTTTSNNNLQEKYYAQFKDTTVLQQGGPKEWDQLLNYGHKETAATTPTLQIVSDATKDARSVQDPLLWKTLKESNIKVQLHRRYILTQLKSGFLLIDQRAAHERVLYERYLCTFQSQEHAKNTQQLLFPVRVTLSPTDLIFVQTHVKSIQALGFTFENFGKDSLIVTGCPTETIEHDLNELFQALVAQFGQHQTKDSLSIEENLARSLAKHACIQPGKILSPQALDMLVDQLFACEDPHHTPDKHKTFVIMTLGNIHTLFST